MKTSITFDLDDTEIKSLIIATKDFNRNLPIGLEMDKNEGAKLLLVSALHNLESWLMKTPIGSYCFKRGETPLFAKFGNSKPIPSDMGEVLKYLN